MATYRQIHTKIWSDPKFFKYSKEAKILFLWGFSNEYRNESGLFTIVIPKMALDTGLTVEETEAAMQQLIDSGTWKYDQESNVLWVVNAIKYQSVNTNCLRAMAKDISKLSSYLVQEFIDHVEKMGYSLSHYMKPMPNPLGTHAKPIQDPSLPLPLSVPLSLPIEKEETEPKTSLLEQRFNEFWEKYPKKMSKGQAIKTWKKIKPDTDLFAKIMQSLDTAIKSFEWTKDNGQFIPYPSSWLNAQGWEDKFTENKPKPKKEFTPLADGDGRGLSFYTGD